MRTMTSLTKGAPTAEEVASWRAELGALVQSGHMERFWQLPPEEAFEQAGIGDEFSPVEWALLDWYGPLELWRAPEQQVSDIFYNGHNGDPFFVIRRGEMLDTGRQVHPEWIAWVQRQFLLRSGKVRPERRRDWPQWPRPMIQGVADRLRFAITSSPASHGPTIAVRMLPERWRTLRDMVAEGLLSDDAAALLIEALRCGATLLIAGATGSGKTTLAAALVQVIGVTHRIVFVEDGGELPRTANSVHLEVLDMPHAFSEAVRFTLRQKPSYTVVGEVRGGEAMAMLQAAATGHPGIGTIHATNVQAALRNLERNAMLGLAAEAGGGGQAAAQIVRGLISSDSVNLLVVHIGHTSQGRRAVLSIEEVLRMGAQGQSGDHFPTSRLFQYDEHQRALVRVGYVNAAWGEGRV